MPPPKRKIPQDLPGGQKAKTPSNGGGKRNSAPTAPGAAVNRVSTRASRAAAAAAAAPSVPVDGDPRRSPAKDKVEKPRRVTKGKSSAVQKASKGRAVDPQGGELERDRTRGGASASRSSCSPTAGHDHESVPTPKKRKQQSSDDTLDEEEPASPSVPVPAPKKRKQQPLDDTQDEEEPASPSVAVPKSRGRQLKKRVAQAGKVLPSTSSQVELPVPRGRGRPPKKRDAQAEEVLPSTAPLTVPKRRGRPPKNPDAQAGEVLSDSTAMIVSPLVPQRENKESKPGTGAIYLCSPIEFVKDIVVKLKDRVTAMEIIKKIDWDNVLKVQNVRLKKKVIQVMIDCFDIDTKMLILKDEPIDIKPLVQKIVGLPNVGSPVNRVDPHDDPHLYKMLTVPGGHSVSAKAGFKLLEKVLESVEEKTGDEREEKEREFCILFILETFSYYLGPKASRNLERAFLKYFRGKTLQQLKDMRWCDLIGDFLIECIIIYKNNKARNRKLFGCSVILMDLFYDFVAIHIRDERFPRANHISQKDLNTFSRMKVDELKDLVKKQARRLNETVYKNDYKVGKVASNGTVANTSLSGLEAVQGLEAAKRTKRSQSV